MRRIRAAVSVRSRTLMPATGSSSMMISGSCISSMPISSHCFWPWLRMPASVSSLSVQADLGGDVLALLLDRGGAAEQQAAEDAAAGGVGEFEVFEDGEVFVDRRVLEFPADAGADDPVFPHAAHSLPLNLMLPLVACVLPQIRSSTVVLPAPLGPMMTWTWFWREVEVEAIDGFEAVEGNAEVFDFQNVVVISVHRQSAWLWW